MNPLDRLVGLCRPLSGRAPLFVIGVVIGLMIMLLHAAMGGRP